MTADNTINVNSGFEQFTIVQQQQIIYDRGRHFSNVL